MLVGFRAMLDLKVGGLVGFPFPDCCLAEAACLDSNVSAMLKSTMNTSRSHQDGEHMAAESSVGHFEALALFGDFAWFNRLH